MVPENYQKPKTHEKTFKNKHQVIAKKKKKKTNSGTWNRQKTKISSGTWKTAKIQEKTKNF